MICRVARRVQPEIVGQMGDGAIIGQEPNTKLSTGIRNTSAQSALAALKANRSASPYDYRGGALGHPTSKKVIQFSTRSRAAHVDSHPQGQHAILGILGVMFELFLDCRRSRLLRSVDERSIEELFDPQLVWADDGS